MGIPTKDVERLMKACQRGVGGPGALNKAHDIMADAYGTLGSLVAERDALLEEVARLRRGETICIKCGIRQDAKPEHTEKDPFPF